MFSFTSKMKIAILFIVIALRCSQGQSNNDVRVISVSKEGNSTSQTVTFVYESTTKATVVWITHTKQQKANINTFELGRGIAVYNGPPLDGFIYYTPGGENLYQIGTRGASHNAIQIPQTEIKYSGGNEVVYTTGQTLQSKIRWTKLPNATRETLSWNFVGLDPSTTGNTPMFYGSHFPDSDEVARMTTETVGNEYETSVSVNLQDQSGLVILSTMYETDSYLTTAETLLPIHPAGQPVFPDNFLDFLFLRPSVMCYEGYSCNSVCLALGPNIQSVHITDASGNILSAEFGNSDEWYFFQYFSLPRTSGSYSCVATNSQGQVQNKEFQVTYVPNGSDMSDL